MPSPETDWRAWLRERSAEPPEQAFVTFVPFVPTENPTETAPEQTENEGRSDIFYGNKRNKSNKSPPQARNCVGADTVTPTPSPWAGVYQTRLKTLLEQPGMDRETARADAYEAAIHAWSEAHPLPPPQDGRCASCGFPLSKYDGSFYLDGGTAQPLPLHDTCVVKFQQKRRAEAVAGLKVEKIPPLTFSISAASAEDFVQICPRSVRVP